MRSAIGIGRVALLIAAIVFASPLMAASTDYLLGPQDKLRIKVYDLRNGLDDAHEWAALNGEYVVGASGDVSLPLIGDITAANGSTSLLARTLVERLQAKIGLAHLPDAAVEVVEYRPFYVLGLVQKSGEYAFRPGLTVLQAIGVAGGLLRPADPNILGLERDAIASHGDLRALMAERAGLLVRQARLDAEVGAAPAIIFGADILALKAVPSVERAMREEQLIFSTYRDEQAAESASLGQARDLLLRQIDTLSAKDAAASHQYDLAKKELDQVASLVGKGMAVVPRQLALEESVTQIQSARLDVQLMTMRARQDIAKIEQSLIQLRSARRTAALSEARETGARLAAINERITTAQSLIDQAEVYAPDLAARMDQETGLTTVYALTRMVAGVMKTTSVAESDLINPGDTLRVERAALATALVSR